MFVILFLTCCVVTVVMELYRKTLFDNKKLLKVVVEKNLYTAISHQDVLTVINYWGWPTQNILGRQNSAL